MKYLTTYKYMYIMMICELCNWRLEKKLEIAQPLRCMIKYKPNNSYI